MGLFFNRKKNKKAKRKQDENDVLDLGILEPLDLTNTLEEETPAPTADKTPPQSEAAAASLEPEAKEQEPAVKAAPPIIPPVKVESTGDPTRDAMAQQFAELRRVVAQRQVDDEFQAKAEEVEPEPIKEKARGIFARKKKVPDTAENELADFVETEVEVEPQNVAFEPLDDKVAFEAPDVPEAAEPSAPAAMAAPELSKASGRLRMQMDESWLGLWVAEDGRAIVIEEGDPGDYFVSAMPDPMSKCYTGPDYPEIETWRMPAEYVREPVGEIEGDRVVINTVPGLPEEHEAPTVFLYFLTADEEEEGENRFAQRGDRLRAIFMVSDSAAGTVNPWGDGDDVLWLGEPASFYKAPEKLDLYIDKRLRKGDPSNFAE
ncbi:MAG: hypothetical protein EP347_05695 [Alphaproteobacteria bacterium]|nr:MAG: hypothetical protein EP347_05695 [Alphaproteobacteria bacterium]